MRALPDVTTHVTAEKPSTLKWVGMEDIAVPIFMNTGHSIPFSTSAKADVYVSLDSQNAKGIHMSRLHNVINQLAEVECNRDTIEQLLTKMIASQNGIGSAAKIKISFDMLIKKSALLSEEYGFQTYPISISAKKNAKGITCYLELMVPYSSTCPCSASLARQLYADAINETFIDENIDKETLIEWVQSQAGSVATPHSQRSYAYLKLSLGNEKWPDIRALILQVEKILGTPVQTAVKRIDEQEFAKLNAENLMFCEDAARKIKHALEQNSVIKDYWFKVEHQESLHAHNAVVIDKKFP